MKLKWKRRAIREWRLKRKQRPRLRNEWGWVTSTFWDIFLKGMVDGFPLVLEYTEHITHPGIVKLHSPIQSTTPLFQDLTCGNIHKTCLVMPGTQQVLNKLWVAAFLIYLSDECFHENSTDFLLCPCLVNCPWLLVLVQTLPLIHHMTLGKTHILSEQENGDDVCPIYCPGWLGGQDV